LSPAGQSVICSLGFRYHANRVVQTVPTALAQLAGEGFLAFIDRDCIIATFEHGACGLNPRPWNPLAVNISVRHGVSFSTS
jgi:hypothetical protein